MHVPLTHEAGWTRGAAEARGRVLAFDVGVAGPVGAGDGLTATAVTRQPRWAGPAHRARRRVHTRHAGIARLVTAGRLSTAPVTRPVTQQTCRGAGTTLEGRGGSLEDTKKLPFYTKSKGIQKDSKKCSIVLNLRKNKKKKKY